MWWNAGEDLWSIRWDMSDNSIDGTMMGQNSHTQMGSQSLVQLVAFASSWSLMMNPPFSRTMSTTQDGVMQPANPNQRPKAMASC